MDAYKERKGTKEAQIQVKKFETHKQQSHWWVGKTVAMAFGLIGPIRLIYRHLEDVAWEWSISECLK